MFLQIIAINVGYRVIPLSLINCYVLYIFFALWWLLLLLCCGRWRLYAEWAVSPCDWFQPFKMLVESIFAKGMTVLESKKVILADLAAQRSEPIPLDRWATVPRSTHGRNALTEPQPSTDRIDLSSICHVTDLSSDTRFVLYLSDTRFVLHLSDTRSDTRF